MLHAPFPLTEANIDGVTGIVPPSPHRNQNLLPEGGRAPQLVSSTTMRLAVAVPLPVTMTFPLASVAANVTLVISK